MSGSIKIRVSGSMQALHRVLSASTLQWLKRTLSYLKRFPWDYVKIYRSFVKDIELNSDYVAIIEAITVMVHSLKFAVVAEGVETLNQLNVLKNYGIDCVQGFLLAHPEPAKKWQDLDSISSKTFLKEAFESDTISNIRA